MTHHAPEPWAAGRPPSAPSAPFDALVLAGDGSRRLGGADKPSVTVGGRTLLDRVLAACADAASTTVVGPRRPTYRPVTWAREDPPGGGPMAALEAGLRGVRHGTVLLLSSDVPFLAAETVRELLDVRGGDEGTVLHDGRDQPLLAAYRTEALRRELALLHAEYGTLRGIPLRLLLDGLSLRRAPAPPGNGSLDCDTWGDIATARARIRDHGTVLDEWIAAVKAELGIELDVETGPLLDLARDAAHGVARPAAPLTTFLVGFAAARAGGTPEDVADAARKAAALARRWSEEDTTDGTPNGNADGNSGR
ncbi:NTP transferase domain-containing protein [Streptomyces albiaxialis]|uniref:NTP transferase domain-containing protein n=1 Tax=Streptomyces albiaxialis TaxID=329523 RepID=A0ABN2W7X2_9ACTN